MRNILPMQEWEREYRSADTLKDWLKLNSRKKVSKKEVPISYYTRLEQADKARNAKKIDGLAHGRIAEVIADNWLKNNKILSESDVDGLINKEIKGEKAWN